MIEITPNTNLCGIKVWCDNSFNAVLQGSYRRSNLFNDYFLEVETSEIPVSEVLASMCEIIEQKYNAKKS